MADYLIHGEYCYIPYGNSAAITGYRDNGGKRAVVPPYIGKYRVTEI